MPTKKTTTTTKVKKTKNSLVGNINKRKRAGKSRPKSRSTVTKAAYGDMKKGWPKSRSKKRSVAAKTRARAKKRSSVG